MLFDSGKPQFQRCGHETAYLQEYYSCLGSRRISHIGSSQSPLGKTFLLKELTIHKRFLQEGMATIKLLAQMIQIVFSNCPPNQLVTFLKCLSLKLAQSKQNGIASNRRRLLSDKARSFENISPLTDKDFTVDCKKRPLEDKNGVVPKRITTAGTESDSNCGNDEHSGPARRRLSSLSSWQMNLIPEQWQ